MTHVTEIKTHLRHLRLSHPCHLRHLRLFDRGRVICSPVLHVMCGSLVRFICGASG